jgi:Asp/Glu/hydantoin racemase
MIAKTRLGTLGLIHTSATLVPVFAELCREWLPGVNVFNLSDDSLIKEVIAHNRLTPSVTRRVVGYVAAAESAGADVVLVTCSSIGPAVELAAHVVNVPVIRVDQAMADRAVRNGGRIGVAATLQTTLEPTADLIQRRAELAGTTIRIHERLCEGAFEALMEGAPEKHDRMVAAALEDLACEVDVIVLAQASMSRVAGQMKTCEASIPMLTSPTLAIEYLAQEYLCAKS